MKSTITLIKSRQGILLKFSKLASIIATFFLASCNTIAPEVTPDEILLMDLNQVDIDLDAGTITGTTTAMQYSLTSTNGTDGTWIAASDGNTAVTFVEGDVYIRESANPSNVRLVKTIGPGMIIVVDLDAVAINVAEGNITGTITEMEYSLNSTNGTDGTWAAASNANTAVTFVAGKVYVREAEDHENVRLVATIAPAAAAPALTGDDNTNTISGLTASHEYKIDAGAWTDGTTAPDLTGAHSVQVRIKATASELPSLSQTITFTAGPILFENFEGTADLLTRGWDLTSGVTAYSTTNPGGGSQSLFLEKKASINRTFPLTQDAIVEWKIKATTATSNIYMVLYEGSASTTGVVRVNLYKARLVNYPKTTSGGSGPIIDPAPVGEWITFRIELTGNTFAVYMNGTKMGNTSYPTMEDSVTEVPGARQKISRINFVNMVDTDPVYIDDIKITTKPAP